MRYLYRGVAIAVGLFFMLFALLKAADPMGTILKVEEYLQAMGLEGLQSLSTTIAALLCLVEFIIGAALAAKVRMALAVPLLLLFMAVMTIITILNLTILPIDDCGCFGEAIKLSNTETFLKNLLLLGCALFLLLYPKGEYAKRISISPKRAMLLMGAAVVLELLIFSYSLWYKPLADFGQFRKGTDLREMAEGGAGALYDALFVYQKEGRRESFTLDNLPDTTWTFVESIVSPAEDSPSGEGTAADFQLKNGAGEYIAQDILGEEGRVLFSIVNSAESLSLKDWETIFGLAAQAEAHNARFYLVCCQLQQEVIAAMAAAAESLGAEPAELPYLLYTDKKTALSLNRLNGGLVVVDEGVLSYKDRLTSTIW